MTSEEPGERVVRALCFVLVRARVCGPRACVCQVCCSVSENGERAVRASACNETVVSVLESETRSEREGDASARYVRGAAVVWTCVERCLLSRASGRLTSPAERRFGCLRSRQSPSMRLALSLRSEERN